MGSESSPLHIINPTGFEIQLLKSIVSDDALLATMRVEGTIPGFEVTVSDTQLEAIIMASALVVGLVLHPGFTLSQYADCLSYTCTMLL